MLAKSRQKLRSLGEGGIWWIAFRTLLPPALYTAMTSRPEPWASVSLISLRYFAAATVDLSGSKRSSRGS